MTYLELTVFQVGWELSLFVQVTTTECKPLEIQHYNSQIKECCLFICICLFVCVFVCLSPLDHTSQSSLSRALAAVKTNDPSTLTRCLPSLLPEDGLPLLKLAAERGHVGCVRLLLAENKFESFQASGRKEEMTPLHLAAKNARKRLVMCACVWLAGVKDGWLIQKGLGWGWGC